VKANGRSKILAKFFCRVTRTLASAAQRRVELVWSVEASSSRCCEQERERVVGVSGGVEQQSARSESESGVDGRVGGRVGGSPQERERSLDGRHVALAAASSCEARARAALMVVSAVVSAAVPQSVNGRHGALAAASSCKASASVNSYNDES